MNLETLIRNAASIMNDDALLDAAQPYHEAVYQACSNNGELIAAVVMDATAFAVAAADTPEDLQTIAELIQQSVIFVLSRRAEMLAAKTTQPEATVH